jgi:hypothetical protein
MEGNENNGKQINPAWKITACKQAVAHSVFYTAN